MVASSSFFLIPLKIWKPFISVIKRPTFLKVPAQLFLYLYLNIQASWQIIQVLNACKIGVENFPGEYNYQSFGLFRFFVKDSNFALVFY